MKIFKFLLLITFVSILLNCQNKDDSEDIKIGYEKSDIEGTWKIKQYKLLYPSGNENWYNEYDDRYIYIKSDGTFIAQNFSSYSPNNGTYIASNNYQTVAFEHSNTSEYKMDMYLESKTTAMFYFYHVPSKTMIRQCKVEKQ